MHRPPGSAGPIIAGRPRANEELVDCIVIPGREANPESRDSGFDASHRPGMTQPNDCRKSSWQSRRVLCETAPRGCRRV
ncbi:hypothetical protein E3H11_29150 [Bradyrhizobium brasilense]|nr:hypothetical protein [Bradyrhizobium brasilense]